MTRPYFDIFVRSILEVTEGRRFSRSSERIFQTHLQEVFEFHSFDFEREHPLTPRDRVDFFFKNGVALECKVEGSLQAHLRQMRRYAEHPSVSGVILVAMRPFPMPETLAGKPVTCLNFAPKCL